MTVPDPYSIRLYVGPSVCRRPLVFLSVGLRAVRRSVRWFVSDGFVMLLLFVPLGATYGRGSGLGFTEVSMQFMGSGTKGGNKLW